MLLAKSGGGGAADKLYVDDVFSTYLYTGNDSTQTITNGIDLAGEGGLVWCKSRLSANSHRLFDTDRGVQNFLSSNTTGPNNASGVLTSFNSNGFTLGGGGDTNNNADNYASWTFSRAPKFFDVQTKSHTNGSATTITLSDLGTVGQVIAKRTDSTGDWIVWHRSLTASNNLRLNTTAAQTTTNAWLSVSGTTATLSASAPTGSYVIYAFAHDTEEDGMIQCGSFTTDGSGNATVNLGWEPQYIRKRTDAVQDWYIFDSARALVVGGNDAQLKPYDSSAEISTVDFHDPTATGFTVKNEAASGTYIYLAIRRPNKPPTSGTEVYAPATRTGTGAAVTTTSAGFPVDLSITKKRSSTTLTGARFVDRLRGATRWLDSSATTLETATADTVTGLDVMTGFKLGADATTSAFNTSSHTYVDYYFKRAPGSFDVVAYTGAAADITVPHSLGAAPEFIIIKNVSRGSNWLAWHNSMLITDKLNLNLNSAKVATGENVFSQAGTSSNIYPSDANSEWNASGEPFVAYLFATLPGISKVGSYTGNGSSQTINCGFSAGARFILIKRTDSTGDWYVWDSARGIVAANDPHLSLNTTAAEVTTDDSVDPDNSGFIVNQNANTNINVTSATYIYLAIA